MYTFLTNIYRRYIQRATGDVDDNVDGEDFVVVVCLKYQRTFLAAMNPSISVMQIMDWKK